MTIRRAISAGTVGLLLALSVSGVAADGELDFDKRVLQVVEHLDMDVETDRELASVYAELMRDQYGTSLAELRWALDEGISWGRITILSYFQATTGRSFGELTSEGADTDVSGFTANVEMSPEKMIGSLDVFLKLAERERNSMIFKRLRSARRIQLPPDLGSGFGLFQEALDFRRIESPRLVKIHSGKGSLAKGSNKGRK